ncbi:proton-coupled zinc antiporter SLC30A8-like [Saccostrea echinata]|uniref:proton-coupled zinc antiporter SLC30A8-like n=1 Tax=Saccostrea echinata TaxID=191078 RepID=UPI002A83EA1B|nr:proton-coupled zinc antiporter SLC30A8-like [Saccostrea echinata]
MTKMNSNDSITMSLRKDSAEGTEENKDDTLSHCHTEKNQDIFDKKARRQLIIASIFCSIFMIGEAVGGALAGSLAIMSDAAHLLTDFASFGISLVAMHLTIKRRTKKLSFGWYRAEIIGALMSILFLWILTGVLVYLGVERIINPDYTIDPLIMLITASAGVVINVIMGTTLHQGSGHNHSHGGGSGYSPTDSGNQSPAEDNSQETNSRHLLDDKQKLVEYGSISNQNVHDVEKNDHAHGHSHKKEKNINVRAAFIHVLGDLVQSLGVLVAAVIIWFKPEWKIADPICTFLFSILVIFTTMHIVKDIVIVLMEGAPRTVNFVDVTQSLLEIDGVREVHDLRMWSLSMNKIAIAVHLAVEKDRDPMHVLRVSTRIVRKKFGISESVIQIEEYHPTMSDCHECRDPPD